MADLDHYTLLGVSPYASAREIDQAYRALIERLGSGPDGSPALVGLLRDAHLTLSDPRRRAEYDRRRATDHGPGAAVVQPKPVPQPQLMYVPVHDETLLRHLKKWRRRRRIAVATILGILLLWWLAANMSTWYPPQ